MRDLEHKDELWDKYLKGLRQVDDIKDNQKRGLGQKDFKDLGNIR